MPTFPITTFAPDMPPTTPGIALDVDGVYPSDGGGFSPVPGPSAMSEALASECLGAFTFQDLSVNFRTVAGTQTNLYELQADNTWIDVSASTSGYSVTDKWDFAAWGNWLLAVNYGADTQKQTATGSDFAALGGSPPQAKFITCSNNFVILANVTDTSAHTNRVQWCAQGDAEDWTPSATTQAGYDDLDDTQGEITGLVNLGEYVVVFKESSLYLGQYLGPPQIWGFRKISSTHGCKAGNAFVVNQDGLFYPAADDFYMFDGNLPRPIGKGIRKYFVDNMNHTYAHKVLGAIDYKRGLILWFFPNTSSTGTCNDCLIFDTKTARWGRKEFGAEAVLVHWQSGVVYDTIADYYATYDAITTPIIYDSPWWSQASFDIAIVDTSHILQRLSGSPDTSTILTGYQGNPVSRMEVTNIWPNFATDPTRCLVSPVTKPTMGGSATTGSASTWSNGKVDMVVNARYLAMSMAFLGNYELISLDVEGKEISRN